MAKDLKEQIEIMTHYLNGGEVECLALDKSLKGWYEEQDPSFSWGFFDYRIKKQKNTITIEKWLTKHRHTERFEVVEGNNDFFEDYNSKYKKIRLLESYELEL